MIVTWMLVAALHVTAAWNELAIERTHVKDFDPHRYYKSRPVPFIVKNVLSSDDCEFCSNTVMSFGENIYIDLQRQSDQGAKIFSDVKLDVALNRIIYESNTKSAYIAFCEGLLESHPGLQALHQLMTKAKEDLFSDDTDWFTHYFPRELTPTDAVIMAGAGAISTLHRDPFEWTGTSLCIEGSKVWRFIDPQSNVQQIDNILKSYRLESNAWNGSSQSAGWQSDFSLYETRHHDEIKGTEHWLSMNSGSEKSKELWQIGSSTEILKPSVELQNLSIHTVIQEAGDMILIPAHWWHQTFALEPSFTIASQRCGGADSIQVLQHILNCKAVASMDAQTILKTSASPMDAVMSVLSASR
jgi:Cupin-like domain